MREMPGTQLGIVVVNIWLRAKLTMHERFKTLLEEENVISLRTAYVVDDGNLVAFQLMPVSLESSIPSNRSLAPKHFDWVFLDHTYLYRHLREDFDETQLLIGPPCVEQEIKPLKFCGLPELRLLWTDSGNTVALYLDGQPWAFIDEETHRGYSKGVLKQHKVLFTTGKQWDECLFQRLFAQSL